MATKRQKMTKKWLENGSRRHLGSREGQILNGRGEKHIPPSPSPPPPSGPAYGAAGQDPPRPGLRASGSGGPPGPASGRGLGERE